MGDGASPTYALEVTPESALQFTLTRTTGEGGTPRCTMTLRHAGGTDEHLAFKVKTTQPRRYLVRPNQGLVAPNTTETVSIILVEKDKQILLQSYDRLGQSALDHSKDKFLVQSCAVSNEFASRYMSEKAKADREGDGTKTGKELAEALTGMWNAVSSGSSQPVFNKKLHVRHVVPPGEAEVKSRSQPTAPASTAPPVKLQESDKASMENMTPEQMFAEVSSLRRKYDELVSFSVNLTAERDILNNTLEQTKRDLNREMAARAALENKQGGAGSGADRQRLTPEKSGFALTLIQVLVVALACFLAGVKATNAGAVGFLDNIPVLGGLLGGAADGLGAAVENVVEEGADVAAESMES